MYLNLHFHKGGGILLLKVHPSDHEIICRLIIIIIPLILKMGVELGVSTFVSQ